MIDWAALVLFAMPVLLAALGETVVQRAGLIHIGLEGAMLLAAFVGVAVAIPTGNPWLGLGAGVLAGMMLALVGGWFSIKLAADQVVVGTAATLLALGLTSTLFRAQYGASGELIVVPPIPKAYGIDAIIVLGVLLVPLLQFLLFKTRWGLATRACGEAPQAADAHGFSVDRLRFIAIAIGGALGGLAGAYLSLGVAGSFAENMTKGRGFVAIAMVTFGRWKPWQTALACLLIGFMESLQFEFQSRGIQVPYQLLLAAPYVVALLVLVFVGKGAIAPAALAQPYRRGK